MRVPSPPTGDLLQRASMIALGLVLLGLSLVNVMVSDAHLWLRLVESGLPIGLSLFFLAFAVVLWERGEPPEATLVIAGWAASGSVVTGALVVWLLAVLALQDVVVTDPTYLVASASTVGATFGGAAGFYHAQLRKMTSELQRQNMRLDEFASIVSHDLRNPLGVAMGGLTLARERGTDEDFERVERGLMRMNRMIDELLTLAREGVDVSRLEPVSLREIALEAYATSDAEFDLSVPEDAKFRADPERLAALFENLFRNSVEHGSTPAPDARGDGSGDAPDRSGSPDGNDDPDPPDVTDATGAAGDATDAAGDATDAAGDAGSAPSVTVGLLDDGEGFYVEDDGPGIPPGDRQEVFDQGYTTAPDGTGIGLSIVRRITEAHGWTVDLTEGDSGGARFEFRT